MTVNIKTPKSGTPTHLFVISLRDEVIGNIIFNNSTDLKLFEDMYDALQTVGFGSIRLDIDVSEENEA